MTIRATGIALIALIAMTSGTVNVLAADIASSGFGLSAFSFNAFGTVGEVHSSQDQADFSSSVFVPNGAGYTRSWSAEVDSLIGAQGSARITPALTAVIQVIAEQNHNGSYAPHVEWANLKYDFTSDISVRVGRSVLSSFLYSDTRNVGYTYLWVRPPVEVYTLNPDSSSDGVDISFRFHPGGMIDTVQGFLGQMDSSLPHNLGASQARNSWGVSNIAEYRPFAIRVAFQTTHLTIPSSDSLFSAFRQFGGQGNAIAERYDADRKPDALEQVGATYDSGHWLLISEWCHVNAHSFIGDQTAWYASAGYRIGKFTPYLTWSVVRAFGNTSPGLTLTGLPPAAAGFAAGLNGALNSLLESIADQRNVSAGARWDFARNFDFKLQFDHIRLGAASSGTLINLQPGFTPGGTVNLFSANVDFVF
jgi:hypothetical protein